jgi:hypothetical protein
MAKTTKGGLTGTQGGIRKKPKKKGSAAKTKTSSNPSSKNYKKPYKGQGR